MARTDRQSDYDLLARADEALSAPIYDDPDAMDTLEAFEESEVEWLIPQYLPKGQITLICGTGGTGKTSVWVSLVASLSSGRPTLFDESDPHRDPKDVMFFSAEDTVENVIKKKLRLQEANMRRIRTMSISDERFDHIKFGSVYLESMIERYKPSLCVFDPLQAFIDARIKMSDRNAMRQNMRSLIEWGKKYGTTFLIVMHTNKQQNVWGRQRMADSADLWDIARCVWMVGETPDSEIKYLSHEKSNYGRTGDTMLFTNTGGQPAFHGWTDLKDRDYVQMEAKKRNETQEGPKVDDAIRMIMSTLSEYPEGMTVKSLGELMDEIGYGKVTLKKAKAMLKESGRIRYFKTGLNGEWRVKKA